MARAFLLFIFSFVLIRHSCSLVLYAADSERTVIASERKILDQNAPLDQERVAAENDVDEFDGRSRVAYEDHMEAMKRNDHPSNYEEKGNTNQDRMDFDQDGEGQRSMESHGDGEDRNMIDHHVDGGLPLISDSVFSLIIMVYVLLAFFFVFFLFCWRRGGAPTNQLEAKEGTHCLLKSGIAPPVVTPPTPPACRGGPSFPMP